MKYSTGYKHFHLLLIKTTNKPGDPIKWVCCCDCGKLKEINQSNLRRTKSCGCLARKLLIERNKLRSPGFKDLCGERFGRLLVLSRFPYTKSRKTMWNCLCDCGQSTVVNAAHLKKGRIISCGCYLLEITSKRMIGNDYGKKHGLANHPLRFIRKAMLHRCYNPNNKYYPTYGGRGIKVCDEWKESLENFVSWAESTGWKKGLSIDREDNDGDYCVKNCRWITISENSRRNALRLWEEGIWKRP